MKLAAADVLPEDYRSATLIGRVWVGGTYPGPRTCVLHDEALFDLSYIAPTLSDLCDLPDAAARAQHHDGPWLYSLDEALDKRLLLAPCDFQAIKASGVTFAGSVIERVIEERAAGDPRAAAALNEELSTELGGMISGVKPGSAEALRLKRLLAERGMWSPYLEVAIGPDPEIFTKAQPLSAVGCGAEIGLHSESRWNCSEPEIVVVVSSHGEIVGAVLGNDLTMRDIEGRSALLLARAKDNNASCAIGPFVRLFDGAYGLADVRAAEVTIEVDGPDGFHVQGANYMRASSRDPLELVRATISAEHQYPDGLMLFLGTMFVPTRDRDGPGTGFTHRPGDVVRVSSPRLGTLHNVVTTSDRAPPWKFGIRALASSLASRGLRPGIA